MRYLLLLFLLLTPLSADAVWFDSDWDYRVKVEVNPNQVGTTSAVTNFPVYLDLAGMPDSFWSVATTGDVRVVESDEVTETAFEIVTFSTTTKRGELHFLADSLSTTSSSTFYIYYGNPAATAYAVTDTFGRNNVWTTYAAAWHLEGLVDSKNSLTLTNNNAVAFNSAQIQNGADYGSSNTNKFLNTTDTAGLSNTSARTLSLWANVTTAPTSGNVQHFFGQGYDTNDVMYIFEYGNFSGTLRLRVGRARVGTDDPTLLHTITLTPGTWYHLMYSIDGSLNQKLYVNGVNVLSNTAPSGSGSFSFTTGTYAGRVPWGSQRFMSGETDEMRISSSVLTDAWAWTEYNNQSATSTFFYIGPEETDAPPPAPEATTTPQTILQGGVWSGATIIQ